MEFHMKRILTIAIASTLLGTAGIASAQPAQPAPAQPASTAAPKTNNAPRPMHSGGAMGAGMGTMPGMVGNGTAQSCPHTQSGDKNVTGRGDANACQGMMQGKTAPGTPPPASPKP
jgi:hypothetical protein